MTGRQGREIAIAAAGGIAAALLLLWVPVGLIEMVVASSGLSEAVPAAAPPLGMKARLLIAAFAALMVVGLIGVLRRNRPDGAGTQGTSERRMRVQGATNMGFAFSRLTAMARGRVAPASERDAPLLRRADAHPDAPARAPIFASRDFNGLDIFPDPQARRRPIGPQPEPEQADIVPSTGLAMPGSPPPLADADLPLPISHRAAAPLAQDATRAKGTSATPQPTHGLSIAQLTERLERGLTQRMREPMADAVPVRVIADMPITPAVPVRDTVAPDADEALRAALGALRTMAGRAR